MSERIFERLGLKAIAVGALRRTVQLPEVPTIAESGMPGFEATNWYGLFAPAGVPKEIVARINADVNRALQASEIRDKIVNTGGEPMGGGSDAFATFVRSEVGKWGKTIKDANIKFD